MKPPIRIPVSLPLRAYSTVGDHSPERLAIHVIEISADMPELVLQWMLDLYQDYLQEGIYPQAFLLGPIEYLAVRQVVADRYGLSQRKGQLLLHGLPVHCMSKPGLQVVLCEESIARVAYDLEKGKR